jgi:hypothetical protein
MKTTICIMLALAGALWGQQSTTALRPGDAVKLPEDRVAKSKPPAISDAAKLAAWKAQALVGVADAALKVTKEYKEWEARQTQLQTVAAQLQAACGEAFQVNWTPDGIACVPKPAPVKPEK